MKDSVAIPSLGTDGWIKESAKGLDKLMAYVFESDRSQSYSYEEHIVSIPYIYATYKDDPGLMAKNMATDLTVYLSRHFSVADVQCHTSPDVDNPNNIALILTVSVTDTDGKKYDLNKLIKGDKSKIKEIVDYLNG